MHSFVAAFTGSHYYVMDYLAEEVLNHQTGEDALVFTADIHAEQHVRFVMRRRCSMRRGQNRWMDRQCWKPWKQMNLFVIPTGRQATLVPLPPPVCRRTQPAPGALFPHQLPELHRRASQNGTSRTD